MSLNYSLITVAFLMHKIDRINSSFSAQGSVFSSRWCDEPLLSLLLVSFDLFNLKRNSTFPMF